MTALLVGAADCPGDYQDLMGSAPPGVRSPTNCWHPLDELGNALTQPYAGAQMRKLTQILLAPKCACGHGRAALSRE